LRVRVSWRDSVFENFVDQVDIRNRRLGTLAGERQIADVGPAWRLVDQVRSEEERVKRRFSSRDLPLRKP
jgi:hypothetical protein